jgi:hypothetical protein
MRRVLDRVSVEVGRAILPPHRSPLSQPALSFVDEAMGDGLCVQIYSRPGVLHGSPRIHQLFHQPLLVLGSKVGIAHPPEPIANDEIAPIRRDWMLQARHQMKGFPPVTATVVPEV